MADKKNKTALYTHWARPRVRTYEYNFEYGESYYRPLVKYISTSRAFSSASSSYSSSLAQLESRREWRRRGGSPPRAMSFIERWANEPFYGYGIGFRSRAERAASEQITSSSALASQSSFSSSAQYSSEVSSRQSRSVSRARDLCSVARAQSVLRETSQSRAESVARAQSVARAHSVAREQSVARSIQEEESLLQALEARSRRARARSVDVAARYASDDCLMRSSALNLALASARALSASQEILNTTSLTRRTLQLDSNNILHGRTLDDRYYVDYPRQHLVCPPNCPLHNSPDWRRRFLMGNRFLDAASLGGFDVLYDPSLYNRTRRLLGQLSERSEYDTEEISIERSSDSESSRRRIRANYA